MVEYALLTAETGLGALWTRAERWLGTYDLATLVVVVAGLWVIWWIIGEVLRPRTH